MRGDVNALAELFLYTKGEYSSDNVEFMGWYSTTVLLICLPVFLTFLAYAGILFYEVATKGNSSLANLSPSVPPPLNMPTLAHLLDQVDWLTLLELTPILMLWDINQ